MCDVESWLIIVDPSCVCIADEFRKFYIGADLDGDGQISETEMRDFLKKTSATD